MGFDFSGRVLRGPRIAVTNAKTTAEPINGVLRDVRPVPDPPYDLASEAPALVEASADQYRAAILDAPGTTTVEYLVWAQNTSNLAVLDDPSWWLEEPAGTIPLGGLEVEDATPDETSTAFFDGTDRAIVADLDDRSIGTITHLVVIRGDIDDYDDGGWVDAEVPGLGRVGNNPYPFFTILEIDQDPSAGIVRLTATDLVLLGGGLSQKRGDQILSVRYTLAPVRFWWTRNDRYMTRFGFNQGSQRWEPFRGGPSSLLGRLTFDTTYQLNPRLNRLPTNAILPGDVGEPDTYAMVRLGTRPDANSLPVAPDSSNPDLFAGIQVRADYEVVQGFDFTTEPLLAGVVGQGSGTLVFNPTYIEANIGKDIWYVPQGFVEESNGVLGGLADADVEPLFLTPLPDPLSTPLLRLGSRQHLSVTLVNTDSELDGVGTIAEGEVLVSLSTGRVRLSSTDIGKANTSSSGFDPQYLGELVVSDGVALNGTPQPPRLPVALVGTGGVPAVIEVGNELYVPDFVALPGLGVSGILQVPDGTGAVPATGTVGTRPGGDNEGDVTTGLVRQVEGVGDTFLFSRKGAVAQLRLTRMATDLLETGLVKQGVVFIASELIAGSGSQISLGTADRTTFSGDALYFQQADLTPAFYTTEARLSSRNQFIFRFDGTEKLDFAVDTTQYVGASAWLASSLPAQDFYTAAEVAASIQAHIDSLAGEGQAYEQNGHIVLEADDPNSGVVEISFGSGGTRNLTGPAALGFMPGWRAVGGQANWLPDSGVSVGLARSPVNLDRTGIIADYKATARISRGVLQASINVLPDIFLDQLPLQDVAGIDEDLFFNLTTVTGEGEDVQIVDKPLVNFSDVIYRFAEGKFSWAERDTKSEAVQQAVATINLGHSKVFPETLLGAPEIGGGLFLAEDGGRFQFLEQGTDYRLVGEGQPGIAQLIARLGARVLFGSGGVFSDGSNTFTDTTTDFTNSVEPGYRLKITSGEAAGSYIVTALLGANSFDVSPAFLAGSERPVPWELFEGFTDDVYDPSLVADVVYKPFNHLQKEPFKARFLSLLGDTPTSAAVQRADRLQANMGEALDRGRVINIRFGLEASTNENTATLLALDKQELGELVNDTLVVPETKHFLVASFSILVGTVTFEQGVDLIGVLAFSPDPGDTIEYLEDDWIQPDGNTLFRGTLRFGSDLLADMASSSVWYVETFRDPSDVPELVVEYRSSRGDLNIAQTEIDTFGAEGVPAYFVEQMITEDTLDIGLSPLAGAFALRQPAKAGQVVEVEYYKATTEGRKIDGLITEFLPVFVQDETATQTTPETYLFNPEYRTVDERFDPVVRIGPMEQNYGAEKDYVLEYRSELGGAGKLVFNRNIADYIPVNVSYAVFEAAGGEQAYDASSRPVYRPPFFIKRGVSEFGLRGDRTSEFSPGQLLRIGTDCFYVTGTTYYPSRTELVRGSVVQKGDVTGVGIFPETTQEVGSRAPARDALALITPCPVTTVLQGGSPSSCRSAEGFMQEVPVEQFPFEPVSKGQTVIVFQGDLTTFAVPGHILEIGGEPFTIAQVELLAESSRTSITLTTGFKRGFSLYQAPTIKLSYRPVYPPEPRDFIGVGSVVAEEGWELVLFGETDNAGNELPGRTLTQGVHYTIEPASGAISLLEPFQQALAVGQWLSLSFTRLDSLGPKIVDGVTVMPRWYADYRYNVYPTSENGLLGGVVTGTYTFRNPDTLYFRIPTLRSFLAEAVEEALDNITNKQPAGGPLRVVADDDNWDQGRVGLLSQRKHLIDLDRAARVFLEFYNTAIVAFEQINETIAGGFIGDRDGKFRFFVGRGLEQPPPGYEDDITGELNPRNVWALVFDAEDPTNNILVLGDDPIVTPESATLEDGLFDGDFPVVEVLDGMQKDQISMVLNDIDDWVLTGTTDPTKILLPGVWPYYRLQSLGVFERMGSPQFHSRIFPRRVRAFLTTLPGTYSAETTKGTTIGQLANPVIGNITEVTSASVFKRRARGRIWGYLPGGLPADAFGSGEPAAPINRPCLIGTPGLLSDFPINPETGYPDQAQLLSQGGSLPDLTAGDPELSVPGFVQGDQIGWGQTDGTNYLALDGSHTVMTPLGNTHTGVFVEQVLYGCVMFFQDGDDPANPINAAGDVWVSNTPLSGTPADVWPIVQGDTVMAVSPTGVINVPVDPVEAAAATLDSYRVGFDVAVRQDGTLVDLSMPSVGDGLVSGPKEELGQNPPLPQEPIGAVVEFVYTDNNPLKIPALEGVERDDDGDFQLPYMRTGNTELDRFGEASVGLPAIMWASNPGPPITYIYPDEIVGDDGEITGAGAYPPIANPAVLRTSEGFLPATPGPAPVGTGDVQPYDMVLIEVDQPAIGASSQGFLTVGDVTATELEPPRFVTQTTPAVAPSNQTGSPVRFVLDKGIVWMDNVTGYPDAQTALPLPGLELTENTGTNWVRLNFNSIGGPPVFNDGSGIPVGGFNDTMNGVGVGNVHMIIEIIGRLDTAIVNGPNPIPASPWPEGEVLLTIDIETNPDQVTVTDYWGNFNTLNHTSLSFTDNQIVFQVPLPGLFDWGLGTPPANQWFLPHTVSSGNFFQSLYGYEFAVSVDTFTGTGAQSTTAYISPDRLTFNDAIDLRFARERGFVHPKQAGTSLETELIVHEVTTQLGASRVNRDVNGSLQPFTFLSRTTSPSADPGNIGGTFTVAGGGQPEHGAIKVPAFEGYGNTPILAADVRFSALPSNENDENGIICQGSGGTASRNNGAFSTADQYDDRVTLLSVSSGAVSNVEKGDILVVDRSPNATHYATTKAGTWIVNHAIEANSGLAIREVAVTGIAGRDEVRPAMSTFRFPRVLQYNLAFDRLETDGVGMSNFPSTFSSLYVIRSLADISSTDLATFRESVLIADYGLALFTDFLVVSNWRYADGTLISNTVFAALIEEGQEVSGIDHFPIDIPPWPELGLTGDHAVGLHDHAGNDTVYGFRWFRFTSPISGTTPQAFDGQIGAAPNRIEPGTAPVVGNIGIDDQTVPAQEVFDPTPNRVLYPYAPGRVTLALTDPLWDALNTAGVPHAGVSRIRCLLPGTLLESTDFGGGTPGFQTIAGIYLEPSYPRPVTDLTLSTPARPYVIDAAYSLTAGDIGMRDFSAYAVAPAPAFPEGVSFTVRRIRRFHDVGDVIEEGLKPLRYAYEIRRGRITSFGSDNKQHGLLGSSGFTMTYNADVPAAPRAPDIWNDGETYTGTNLGSFEDPDVNVNPGDTVRLLDESGSTTQEIRITAIIDESNLKLASPGFNPAPTIGDRFEVFLRQAPVPHEQSHEQLLDLITDREVHRTFADEAGNQGGYVPDDTAETNRLYDDLEAYDADHNFSDLGVQRGDIVLVDPMGTLASGEMGTFPLGDKGITGRNDFDAGGPDDLDDNRGFYRVEGVRDQNVPPYLSVTGASTFAGVDGSDIVFPGNPSYDPDIGYALYPTIGDSDLTSATEGQADLRPTHIPVGGSHGTNNYSMRPFSYRVIRPSSLFSGKAIDLILTDRERLLSLMEFLRASYTGTGSYYVFQRDEHAHDIGDPVNFVDGLGVLSNLMIENLIGNVGTTPFMNTVSGLSLLDRRFWVLDRRLDSLTRKNSVESRLYEPGVDEPYPGDSSGPYTAYTDTSLPTPGSAVRPMLPERVNEVLDTEDRFRPVRYTWLAYRTNTAQGTLPAIVRFDEELPKRLAELQQVQGLREAAEGVEGE